MAEQRASAAERVSLPQDLKMYIGGQWVDSVSGETFEAISPSTGRLIARLPQGTREDAQRAIEAAREGARRIAKMSTWERAALCHRIADVLEKKKDFLARVIAEDQGKPYHTEAIGEVNAAITGFREAAEHVKWLETSVIPVEAPHKLVYTVREPRGVYAVITPWNFPVNIPTEYIAPGLAAGNAIVWVPAPSTSVCAVVYMQCLEEAGVPPGVVNLVTGPGPVVGDEIVAHPGTDGVGFTGSSATGFQIARRAAGKPLLLELGGNGPTIIMDDANLDLAIPAVSSGCYLTSGQTCAATERILVHKSVHEEVVRRLVEHARQVRLGDPFDPQTTMGPLNNEATAEKTDQHIADAVAKGARVLYGGQRAKGFPTSLYYEPTVIDNVSRDSLLNREETFGPVVPVLAFETPEEAVAIAEDCDLGLSAAVFTEDVRMGMWFARRLRTGIVNINESSVYWELHIPFGGGVGKKSGIGRLGGKHTVMEMTSLKAITVDTRVPGMPND